MKVGFKLVFHVNLAYPQAEQALAVKKYPEAQDTATVEDVQVKVL